MNNQRMNLNGVWSYCLNEISGKESQPELAHWRKMSVPSNWYLNGLPDHAGVVWFRHRFVLDTNLKENEFWLNFDGVDYFAEVWLNGTMIGKHEGYFQSFMFKITDSVIRGENELLVKVDSPIEEPGSVWPDRKRLIKGVLNHHDCRPGGWHPTLGQSYNTGGIWGDVNLLITERIVVKSIKVTTDSITDHTAKMKFSLDIQNFEKKPEEINISIKVLYDGIEESNLIDKVVLAVPNDHLDYTLTISDPHLWWTWDYGKSEMYKVVVILEWSGKSASYGTDFGIRTIYISEEGQLFLNNQPIFLRGTNIIPAQWLSAYQEQEINRDIHLLLDANINAVRVHAHLTKPDFYSACDKAGILVWQDFPLQWGYDQNDEFITSSRQQIIEMVDTLYNHPSIYLWCCHNEPPSGSETFDDMLAELVRKVDTSRYVTPNSTFREHPYNGWYSGCIEQFIALPGGTVPSEFGAQALPVFESLKKIIPEGALWPPDWEIWAFHNFQYDQNFHVAHLDKGDSLETFIENSQNYQYRYIKFSIETYRRSLEKPVFGLFQFMFVDCWPAITWSVVDYYRQLKLGYEALKCAYQPVLISFDIPRFEVVSGQNIFNGVYLINDLNVGFENVIIDISLQDSTGLILFTESCRLDISANSKKCLATTNYLTTKWRIPQDTHYGRVVVRGSVKTCDGKLLSENYENLEVVETFAKEFSH